MENKPKKDHKKVIFNFSTVSLTAAEKSFLVKSLSFSLPIKQLSYSHYLINFEWFYGNIDNLKILSGDNLNFTESRIKDTALTSFRNCNISLPKLSFLTQNFKHWKICQKNCNLVIQKADENNLVFMVKKDIHLKTYGNDS